MKWIKKPEFSLFFIIIIFLSLLIATHWKYNVGWEAIVQTIGSMFGVLIGSFLAGRYAINSVKEQVNYDKEKVKQQEEISERKYDLFLKGHINIIKKCTRSIEFYIKEHETGLNVYEVDFIEKIEITINEMKNIFDRVYNIDPIHISFKQYKFLGEMYEMLHEIESSLEAYQSVTDEDDVRINAEKIYSRAKKLNEYAWNYSWSNKLL
ncbi:hypothetical protein [Halobacillus sp. Nhm2S1]|uniref:hypothetical protein n=1 Tax=Halobacillus sp. Nhm2S1 TaxID=2866716 RepID=UPI001C72DB1E|nr:hypothetical protein [Halobacillus sp. Nhm2S1]MBX0358938.1 hypothetical protein [Halobacillus sp. Nhm2S1]